jgi:hypothetical protein
MKSSACAKDVQNQESREIRMNGGFSGIDFHRRL